MQMQVDVAVRQVQLTLCVLGTGMVLLRDAHTGRYGCNEGAAHSLSYTPRGILRTLRHGCMPI